MCLLRREVLPLSRRGVNGFSPGGEALPQSGPLTAPGLVPLHLKKRGLQNDSMCFILAHSPAQTRWTLCSCLQTHTKCSSSQKIEEEKKKRHACKCPHTLPHTRAHTQRSPFIARITMTGEGGVILLSSTVFALVICKSALCTENDTNPPCLSPQTQAGGDGYLVNTISEGI